MFVSEKTKRRLFRWMEDNRGLIILFFVLPASFCFDLFIRVQHWIRRLLFSAPEDHDKRVARIQSLVQRWNALPEDDRKPMCTSRSNWLSLSTKFVPKHEFHKIPVPLYDVLELDTSKMTVRVEPMVTVGEITAYLNPRGYTLASTLEISDATLGGLALGVGMTTAAHNYGLYQESVVAYEVVTGDGTLVRAERDNEHSDLWKALPWSHGTLGFLVALELRIVPVKPFVRLQYIPVRGKKAYCDLLRDLSGALDKDKETPDYLEATIYSPNEAVVMIGNYADAPTDRSKINPLTRWYKPWFYKHAETFLRKNKEGEEYVPLRDYLLRHNRAIFWVVEDMIPFGNHPLFRLFFGWLLPPKPAFLKFTTTPGVRAMTFTKQVFQDIVLPLNRLEEQIDKATELFDTFPLLVYPCRIYDHGPHSGQLRPPRKDQMVPGAKWGMFNDLGVYGVPRAVKEKKRFDAVSAYRQLEKYIRYVGGYSFLYADIFMSEREFEIMFDHTLYKKVRKAYHAQEAFRPLYEKVKPEINVFDVGKEYEDPL